MKYNHYMNSHFSGCQVIAKARDTCRERDVKIFRIPGYWDVVGVSDGTDSWIAPVSAGLFFRTTSGDVADIMRRLQAGEPLGPIPDAPGRRQRVALIEDELPAARRRVSLDEEAPTKPRRIDYV